MDTIHLRRIGCAQACPREGGGRRSRSQLPRAAAAVRSAKLAFSQTVLKFWRNWRRGWPKRVVARASANEAGPCGYGLHRLLIGLGDEGVVVVPSLIPIKAGDRVKTDRRDALMLAKLHRAGELTAIWIPDAADAVFRHEAKVAFGAALDRLSAFGRQPLGAAAIE